MDWSNIVPTLLGTLIGGFMTWIVTKKSLRKQFKFEMEMKQRQFKFEVKMKRINDLKKILKALIAIKRETKHNLARIKTLKNGLKNTHKKNSKVRTFHLSNNNWLNFNHELFEFELKGNIDEITLFYSIIDEIIKDNFNAKKSTLEHAVKEGDRGSAFLKKNINLIKEKIEKENLDKQ